MRALLSGLMLCVLFIPSPVRAEEETLTVSFLGSPGVLGHGVAQYLRHYSVVWIEDQAGQYVTTLVRNGDWYWADLREWQAASGYDGVSGPTPALPAPACTAVGPACWAQETANGSVTRVPDGAYTIVIETSDLELPIPGGTHVLRIPWMKDGNSWSANPSAANGFSNVSVSYSGRTIGGTYAPAVFAGPDRWITLPAAPVLQGVLFDDGGIVSGTWTQLSGPSGGQASFADDSDPGTIVTFDKAGRYVLRLTADDEAGSASDDVTFWVNAVVVHPVADAVVNSSTPAVNLGGFRNINISDTNDGYWRFDLTSVTGTVVEAMLRLATVEGGFATTPREFRRVADDTWDELAITWNSKPAPDAPVIASAIPGRGWAEFDVTSAVVGELAGDAVLSLHCRSASTPGAWSIFSTKDRQPSELGQHYTPPTLVLFVAPTGQPALGLSFAPTSADEDAGTLPGAGTLTASPAPTTDLVVTLSASEAGELTLPATVTIPAGASFAAFDVSAVPDGVQDGDQTVLVSADAAGYEGAGAEFVVRDIDETNPDAGPDADADAQEDVPDADAGTNPSPDEGGCACRASRSGRSSAWMLSPLLLLGLWMRRRRHEDHET